MTRTHKIFLLLLSITLSSTAHADIMFQFDPQTANDWQAGTQQTIKIQILSLSGEQIVSAIQVDFSYDHDAVTGTSLTGIARQSINSSQMSQDFTDPTDDGTASFFRAAAPSGEDEMILVTDDWLTIAELSYTVGSDPAYPISVVVTFIGAGDGNFVALASQWSGVLEFNGGLYTFIPEETPIELISFHAIEEDCVVILSWVTAVERDVVGFHLWKSTEETGDYRWITNALILSEGNEFTGASYQFTDADVLPGQTYFYKLEVIDLTGTSEFFGPVQVTLQEDPEVACGNEAR